MAPHDSAALGIKRNHARCQRRDAEIVGDDACLDAMCAAEFSCNFIQLGFVAGDQNDGMAMRGEFTGKLGNRDQVFS